MNKSIIFLLTIVLLTALTGCTKKSEQENKPNIQILADKEKELNDREAKVKLKEIELEEREKQLNQLEMSLNQKDTTKKITDITKTKKDNKKTNKEIQKDINKKFENPATTVKDYYEYIQRSINETGNYDANMQKAQKYFPSRSVDKLKNSYRNTKSFSIVEEPKVVSQKNNKSNVVAKVKQTEIIKKDGKDQEVTKTLTVTYNLTANKDGQWVITGNQVKVE